MSDEIESFEAARDGRRIESCSVDEQRCLELDACRALLHEQPMRPATEAPAHDLGPTGK